MIREPMRAFRFEMEASSGIKVLLSYPVRVVELRV